MGFGERRILGDHGIEVRDGSIKVVRLEFCHRLAEDLLEFVDGRAAPRFHHEHLGVGQDRGIAERNSHGSRKGLKTLFGVGELPLTRTQADLHELAPFVRLAVEGEIHASHELDLHDHAIDRFTAFIDDLPANATGLGRGQGGGNEQYGKGVKWAIHGVSPVQFLGRVSHDFGLT